MKPLALFSIVIALAGCSGEAQPVATTAGGLSHHEIRVQDLPAPFATHSASNPPWVSGVPAGAQLHLPPGFHIERFATKLDNPRNMLLAPNGDVFVAETGAGRISILRDANGDGVAEQRFVWSKDVDEPFGLALHGGWLYAAGVDSLVRFPYRPGQTSAQSPPQKLASLPSGGHSTRNIAFSADGSKLYVSIGSASNVSREAPPRAAVMEYTVDGKSPRVFASGLRNPVGLAVNPTTGALWTCVNERDGLGDELVPDYATELRDGAFYGWPYAYLGAHEDPRRAGERPDLVAKATLPSVLIAAHSAPLGMLFYEGSMFPAEYRGSAFVALHGSWNRSRRTGYEVIRVPMRGGKPAGGYDDFVTGWMSDPGGRAVWGRPVGLLVLRDGSLLIADDGGNVIWRVTYGR